MRKIFGMLILLVCVFSIPAFAQRYTIFPQIVSGGGYGTEFILMGDKHPMAGILSFFNEIGALLGIGR